MLDRDRARSERGFRGSRSMKNPDCITTAGDTTIRVVDDSYRPILLV